MLKRPKEHIPNIWEGGGTWGGCGLGGRSSPQASVIFIIKVILQRRIQDRSTASQPPCLKYFFCLLL